MTRKTLYWMAITLIVLIAIVIIPIKNNIIYFPKILERSSTIRMEIIALNIMNIKIPFRTKTVAFSYNEQNNKIEMSYNPNNLACEIKTENKTFVNSY